MSVIIYELENLLAMEWVGINFGSFFMKKEAIWLSPLDHITKMLNAPCLLIQKSIDTKPFQREQRKIRCCYYQEEFYWA